MVTISEDEKLALLLAYKRKVDERVDALKAKKREELMLAYDVCAADRAAIQANGVKVGEAILPITKGKPFIKAERRADAENFLIDNDLVDVVPRKGWEKEFGRVDDEVMHVPTGEIVTEWFGWEDPHPGTVRITGCKPADVLEAMAPLLKGADPLMGLLEGGDDGDD